MSDRPEQIDRVTGTPTTGHEWDGVRELNTPLPRWWLWLFYATIIWSVGYWVVYPAWPLVSSYTQGVLGWNSRAAVVEDLQQLRAQRGPRMVQLGEASLAQISADPQLRDFARALGKPAFGENCAPCHGTGGGGAKGYPNLNDDDWLWGGTLDDIALTIRHGVRAGDDQGRPGAMMPAFGRDNMLSRADISVVADYVRSLSGLAAAPGADLAHGKQIFADNCAACHGEDGKGNRDLGGPNLTDAIWLYGSDKATIVEGVWNGRGAVMPAWVNRLDETTVKALAVFVHSLGGGEK
jgi:cytochrome c oxidase cbb3-type subunit 3